MQEERLVHKHLFEFSGSSYEVHIFARHDGSHVAKTAFSPQDVVISDAPTLHEVIDKHSRLLPLALDSRQILRDFQSGMEPA